MTPLFSYLLHVSVAFAVFYLVYRLVLSNDTFFVRNRFYFLGSMLVSLLSPLLKFKIKVFASLPDNSYVSSYAIAGHTTVTSVQPPEINIWPLVSSVVLILYLTGVVFYLARFVLAYRKIIRIILTSERKKFENLILVITRLSLSPFSLLKWLVIPNHQLYHPDFEKIVQHESIHSRQYHSVDLFLAELLVAFQWFNPFVWWIKKSIMENHEFIVDQAILRNGTDPQQYQFSLLTISTGHSQLAFVNHFNANLLKKRISMMNRNKSPKWHSVKNISIFFVVFAIIAFSATFEKVAIAQANTNSEYQTPIQKEDNIISQQTVIPTIKDTSSIIGNQTQISSVEDIRRFIVEHLRCPISLNRELVLVQVSFTIEKSGTISNIKAYDKTEITAPIKQIEVVAYVPRQKTHAESSNKLDKSNGSVENKHNTGNLNSENILLFRNEVENCLKKLPTCPSGISGLRYTIPVLFTYDKTPGDKSTNDSTKSVEIRNVENDQAYKVKKNDPLPEGPIYFLNGEKISSSEVKSIPPSDILSINVLKDKSAIALYGDEGKNGAVLINTINKVNNSIQSYKEPVFIVVDQNASFQDGDLSKFQNSIETMLNSNLAGTSNDKKTKVFVQFTVDKTGTVGDVNISKSPVPNANQSIIQAILSSPKWKPALQDGKPVKQQFMMPLKISSEIHSAIRMIPKSLVITPNPASGNVEITIPEGNPEKKYEIYVVDGNGKIVLQDKKNGPKITISVLNLKTGIYHIIVNDNGNQCQGSLSVTH